MATNAKPRNDLYDSFPTPASDEWVHGYLLDAPGTGPYPGLTKEEFRPGLPPRPNGERVTQSRFVVLVLTPAYRSEDFRRLCRFSPTATVDAAELARHSLLLQPTPLPGTAGPHFRVPVDATQLGPVGRPLARIAGLLQPTQTRPRSPLPCPYFRLVAYSECAQAALFSFWPGSLRRSMKMPQSRLRQHPLSGDHRALGAAQIFPWSLRVSSPPQGQPPTRFGALKSGMF